MKSQYLPLYSYVQKILFKIWYYITVHKTSKNVLLILHVYLIYTLIWYFRVSVIMSLKLKLMWSFFLYLSRHQNRKVWQFHLQDEYVNFVWLLSWLVFSCSFLHLLFVWQKTGNKQAQHASNIRSSQKNTLQITFFS